MLRGGPFRSGLDLAPYLTSARGDSLERRTIHHDRDCTFAVDGRTINLQERTVMWKQFEN
jgi:hypothetical protein